MAEVNKTVPVEWGKKYKPFAESQGKLTQSKNRLTTLSPIDAEQDDERIESFVLPGIKYILPTQQVVSLQLSLVSLEALKERTPKIFPWGGQIKADFSEDGKFSTTEFPLQLGMDWERKSDGNPAGNTLMKVSAEGKELEGRLTPLAPIKKDGEDVLLGEIKFGKQAPFMFVPFNPEFLASLAIEFNPQK